MSIRVLPRRMDEALALAYLMLRVSDYLEDSATLPRERKITLLQLWQQVITGDVPVDGFLKHVDLAPTHQSHRETPWECASEPDRYAAAAADEILARVHTLPDQMEHAILHHVRASTSGMERWVKRGPDVATEADMDDYMHEVAGRVGYLSTEVFSFYSRPVRARRHLLMPLARETGLALQTVNIIRGVRDDYDRGWVYIPQEFLQRAGIHRAEELWDPAHLEEAMCVLRQLTAKAERHLGAALQYVLLIPRRLHSVRLACIWPLLFAARTVAVCRDNPRALTGEVKVSRKEIRRILVRSRLMGWCNRWLREYTKALLHGSP